MCVDMIPDRLGSYPLVLQLPIGIESNLKGVVDLVSNNAIVWQDESLGAKFDVVEIPEDLKDQAKEYREKLIEKAVEEDDTIMENYLDGNEPSVDDLKKCIRKGTIKGSFVPILTGSAFKNKGVQPLLDAVIDYHQDMEVFANTEDNTTASRKVHVLLSHNGNKMPLNHAPGLNVAFLND